MAALITESSGQFTMTLIAQYSRCLLFLLLPLYLCLFTGSTAVAVEEFPRLNDGKKWRIAYCQGGAIPFYSNIQREIIQELMRRGWIDDAPLPGDGLEKEPLYWKWLCEVAINRYLEFLDPTFSERQLRMSHRVIGFQKLGVAYESTNEGLRYSYMDAMEKVAVDQDFELNRCEVIDTTDDRKKSRESSLSCYRELAADSDAVFITALFCADEEIDALAALFKKERVYSCSFFGSDYVKKSILLGASAEAAYELQGRHYAANIIQVLSGTRPRGLTQVVELPFVISINRTTAEAIGNDIPQSTVAIARGIYE